MIVALINGVEYRLKQDYSIQKMAGNKTSSTINVLVEDQPFPRYQDRIQIVDSDDYNKIYFTGFINMPQGPAYTSLGDLKIYNLICTNQNSIASRRLWNYAAQNKDLEDIVQDFFDEILVEENLTLGQISDDVGYFFESYVVPNLDGEFVMNELAKLTDCVWEIDDYGRFYFLKREDFDLYPVTIDENHLLGRDMMHSETDVDLRTVQTISGPTQRSTPQPASFVYDGTSNTAGTTVDFAVVEEPVFWVNNEIVDPVHVGVVGLNSGDPNIWFLWSYGSQVISYNEGSNILVPNTDVVTLEYIGEFPIQVTSFNQEAINELAARTGTSGKIENVVIDKTIATELDANAAANSLLENYSSSDHKLVLNVDDMHLKKYGITTDDFSLYRTFFFDLPMIDITGEYVVTEIELSPLSSAMMEGRNDPPMNARITMKDKNFIRAYGETFNDAKRTEANLAIREDEIIVRNISINEYIELTEMWEYQVENDYYCSDDTPGEVFVPMSFDGTGEGVYVS